MSRSVDPDERTVAAQYLCPCHVRKRVESVWEALYRMLEDPDVRVRQSAWHTLDDGGWSDNPALDDILDRVSEHETDPQVRRFISKFAAPRRRQRDAALRLAHRTEFRRRAKCDFCGRPNMKVKQDLETSIPDGQHSRAALTCETCDRAQAN